MTSETSNASARPQDDLFRHINGEWIDTFTIPDDRAGDGAMRELFDTAETKVRDIITSVSDAPQEPGSEGQKVADVFSSFMDLDQINSLGVTPLDSSFAADPTLPRTSPNWPISSAASRSKASAACSAATSRRCEGHRHHALLPRPGRDLPCPTRTTTSTTTTPRCA